VTSRIRGVVVSVCKNGSSNNFVINNLVEQTNSGTGYDFTVVTGSNGNIFAGNTALTSGFWRDDDQWIEPEPG